MGLFSKLFKKAEPKQHKVLVHEAFGGAIRVFESPTDEAWQVYEDSREGDGFVVMVLKYVLPTQPAPLVLLAKIYTLDYAPEPPSEANWAVDFEPLFAGEPAIDVVQSEQLTMQTKLPAYEASVVGPAADYDGILKIRERRSVKEQEQFIVTAMGPSEVFDAHPGDIEKWFENSTFVPMEDANC